MFDKKKKKKKRCTWWLYGKWKRSRLESGGVKKASTDSRDEEFTWVRKCSNSNDRCCPAVGKWYSDCNNSFIYLHRGGNWISFYERKKTIWAARHRILGLDASFVDLLIDNISHDQLAQLLQGCTSNHLFDESFISYKKLFLLQGMPFYQNDSWWIQRKYASSDCIIFSHKHIDPSLLQTISISFSDPISYTFDENKPLLFS